MPDEAATVSVPGQGERDGDAYRKGMLATGLRRERRPALTVNGDGTPEQPQLIMSRRTIYNTRSTAKEISPDR